MASEKRYAEAAAQYASTAASIRPGNAPVRPSAAPGEGETLPETEPEEGYIPEFAPITVVF